MSKELILTILFGIYICSLQAQNAGIIKGRVTDNNTKEPLIGATVVLDGTTNSKGAITDLNGNFELPSIPYGTFSLKIKYIGYEDKEVNDVGVYDSKGVFIEITVKKISQVLDEVVVLAYQNPTESTDQMTTVSARSISLEETKRFAGSLGDPSRMALSYSGVATSGGDNNEIIIRGNSAKYLQWKLEGLEIPNPNHFGVYGSSGGLLNILNTNNLGASNFYLGAFPAHTGNVIGGVFDLSLRDGNTTNYKHSVEMSLIGLSATSEGPLKLSKGANYTINYRYSTLGLIKNLGIAYQAPEYQDMTFKVNLPTMKSGKFTVYGMGGLGTNLEEDFFRKIDSTQFSLNMAGDTIYGFNEIAAENLNKYNIGIIGFKHIIPLGEKSILTNHINYSAVFSAPRSSGVNKDNFTTYLKEEGRFTNSTFRYQPSLNTYFNNSNSIQTGIILSFRSFNSSLIEGYPDFTTKTILKSTDKSLLTQSYVSYQNTSIKKLKIVAGLHYTYFNLNNQHLLEPRLGFNYTLSDKSSLAFASGMHSTTESPEVYLFIDNSVNIQTRNLDMTRSWQTVISYKRKLSEKLFFTAEVYSQYLFDVPIAADSSNFSLINEEVAFTDLKLINKGKGLNYGLELTLEKLFSQSYYFLATVSLFQSEYKLMEPYYRKSKYGSSYVINLLGGKEFKFKENKFFNLNVRANFSGGKPYTPVLLEESIAADAEVRDEKRANFNQLPPYIGVDLSLSHKWIRPKKAHEVKLDVFRLFEQNYIDEIFVQEKLNYDGSITPATKQLVQYGEGQTNSTILPVLYYKLTF
ncbi:MAG: carboxypeptidase-like regulatory domain-containing protein [Chitinophagales bacterium]|nr:carboxypeptidase-like regulatory domain-containing protein [Chitinophagales bacterium]